MFEYRPLLQEPSWISFTRGFFSGLGVSVISFILLFALTMQGVFEASTRFLSFAWLVLNLLGSAILFFRFQHYGGSVFKAGLITAFSLFLLFDAACFIGG